MLSITTRRYLAKKIKSLETQIKKLQEERDELEYILCPQQTEEERSSVLNQDLGTPVPKPLGDLLSLTAKTDIKKFHQADCTEPAWQDHGKPVTDNGQSPIQSGFSGAYNKSYILNRPTKPLCKHAFGEGSTLINGKCMHCNKDIWFSPPSRWTGDSA